MPKQISIFLLLIVFFTQHFGHYIICAKYAKHHDCIDESICTKPQQNKVCCDGVCETKADFDKISKNETEKKNLKGSEKLMEFTNDVLTHFTYNNIQYVLIDKQKISKNIFLEDQYLFAIYRPPCCIS